MTNKKRLSLDDIDLQKVEKTDDGEKQSKEKSTKTGKTQRAIYLEKELDQKIQEYVYTLKMRGDKGASFTRCVKEGLELLIVEKGI